MAYVQEIGQQEDVRMSVLWLIRLFEHIHETICFRKINPQE